MVRQGLFIVFLLLCFSIEAQIDTTVESFTAVSDAPVFSFEKDPLKVFIQKSITYPECALRDSVEGIIIISFYIDVSGETKDHQIKRGIRSDLNEEALRVTKLLRFDRPAMQLEKPIEIFYLVPVDFVLPKKERKVPN